MTTLNTAPPAPAPGPDLAPSPELRRAHLLTDVAAAARVIPSARPLPGFVGLNPLSGLEGRPWHEAIVVAERVLGVRTTPAETIMRAAFDDGRITRADLEHAVARHLSAAEELVTIGGQQVRRADLVIDDLLHGAIDPPPARHRRTLSEALAPRLAAQVDRRTARWCAAYADEGQASWRMPRRDLGLYGAWRAAGVHEPGMPRELRRALRAAPHDAVEAIADALERLAVPDGESQAYFEAHLSAQPGWAAHLRWRESEGRGSGPVDFLAVRLVQEAALLGRGAWLPSLVAPVGPVTAVSAADRAAQLLSRWRIEPRRAQDVETVAAVLRAPDASRGVLWLEAYERPYRQAVLARLGAHAGPTLAAPAVAQVVCCIDARSEGLRRHLEAEGAIETFGFAGFFGMPVAFAGVGETTPQAYCPVPVAPTHTVHERPSPSGGGALERLVARQAAGRSAAHSAHAGGVGAFTMAEAAGLVSAVTATARTLWPAAAGRAARRAERGAARAETALDLTALPLDDRIALMEGALRGIGLVEDFAPVVVFCGHDSHTENNPFAAALACGACGGHGGAPNARVAAALFNDPQVRAGLALRGITVPPQTRAVAALHDTTSDRVVLLDAASEDREHAQLAELFERAGQALARERAAALPGGEIRGRGDDWAQVFPEWGLAGNAALIVAPRQRTRGVDLERRTFLHSYDQSSDPDGAVLEQILTAPLVVAHGLNAQYYASAVDPLHLGSGTKAVHNVVGGIGVTAAAGGDLLLGLPWQSVADGTRLIHEPMRLLVLVEAPTARIDDILARHAGVAHLVDGEWLTLLARATPTDAWQHRADGRWSAVDDLSHPQPHALDEGDR